MNNLGVTRSHLVTFSDESGSRHVNETTFHATAVTAEQKSIVPHCSTRSRYIHRWKQRSEWLSIIEDTTPYTPMEYPREYGRVRSPVSPCSNQRSRLVETFDLHRDLPVPNLGEEKCHDHGWNKHNGCCGNISYESTYFMFIWLRRIGTIVVPLNTAVAI